MGSKNIARAVSAAALTGALSLTGIVTASSAFAWDATVWDKVAYCESSNRWDINTGNGFYGGLQFTTSTWKAFGGLAFADRADHATKAQQIAIARRTLYYQGPGAWPVCSVRAGLTKTNGGADPNAMPVGTTSSTSTTSTATTYSAPAVSSTSTSTSYPKVILTVDGVLGPLTIKEMQKWVGVYPDGVWATSTTKALQAKVGAQVTGVRDRQTTLKVQSLVGATPDGVWGPQTTSALQRYLNKR